MEKINWGSMHLHSKYSAQDALHSVAVMVEEAHRRKWGAIGVTDHGNVAGIFELHREVKKYEMLDFPGIELYVTFDRRMKTQQRWHMCVLAHDTQGWENLIGLSNRAHKQFFHKPVIDLDDLLMLGEQGLLDGLWATTGCFFGIAISPFHNDRGFDTETAYRLSENMIGLLTTAFNGRVLVELMNHSIEDDHHSDNVITDLMMNIADALSLPCLVTSDSHYATHESIPDHVMLKKLVSFGPNPDDAVFPGEGYWVPSIEYMNKAMGPKAWRKGLEGFHTLVDSWDISVPEIDTFSIKMPKLASVKTTPEEDLRALVQQYGYPSKYRDRVMEELDVICDSGFAPYILLAYEVANFCEENDILMVTRGSASGSMVCYLLGITQIDPVKWKLRFDRFLSRIRSSPPDIDFDVQADRRDEVLEHLSQHYAVSHIGTWRELSTDEEDKGSLWVKWRIMKTRQGERYAKVTPADRAALNSLGRVAPFDGIGKNAAGLLIAQDESVIERLPRQYVASSKTFVTSLDKDAVEELGYIKLDVLGLTTLSAIKEMEQTIGIPMEDIPLVDPEVYRMIRKGSTVGVFQLSGYAQRKGMPRLKPRKFEDIVVALALFRPAVMMSGAMDAYLNARDGFVPAMTHHEIIDRHVSSTHGVILFQEQVTGILRDLGMTPEELNKVLKAVKASNAAIGGAEEVMRKIRHKIVPIASQAGFTQADIDWLERAMQAYANYGFNRAHAVSYAHVAARTAWYKYHYPVQFWTAMLKHYTGDPKEIEYRMALKKEGTMMLPPHVNKSEADYSVDKKYPAIRIGLTAINGVGSKAAEAICAEAPFTSLQDLAERVRSRAFTGRKDLLEGHSPMSCPGVVLALHQAGALSDLKHEEVSA